MHDLLTFADLNRPLRIHIREQGIQEFHRKYVLIPADKAAKQRCCRFSVTLH